MCKNPTEDAIEDLLKFCSRILNSYIGSSYSNVSISDDIQVLKQKTI
jgi:hypothetical protein